MKKKLLLIAIPIIFFICFSSTTEALSIEIQTGITSGGLHTYMKWFNDNSGVLFVSTTFPNNTGIPYSDISVTAGCINEEQHFLLRVYDSDVNEYINPENEISKGMATRKIYIEPSTDLNNLTWTAEATDESGFVVFAQITLCFTYDEDIDYRTGLYEEEPLNWEAERKRLRTQRWTWSLQIIASVIIALPLAYKLTNKLYGTG